MAIETYSLVISGVHGQERNDSVQHFKGDGITADDTWTSGKDLIDSWISDAMALWLACLPTSYYIDRLLARRVHPKGVSTEYHKQFQAGAQPGTVSGLAQTQQLCPTIRLIPPMGVKTMGKVFMPAVAKGSIDGNQLTAAYQTAIDGYFGVTTGGFTPIAATWNQVVYSVKLDLVSNVLDWTPSPRIGYQKRRRAPV